MSALGHKRTLSDTLSNVRYWGQSGRSRATLWMSAYSQKRTSTQVTDGSQSPEASRSRDDRTPEKWSIRPAPASAGAFSVPMKGLN